MKRFALRHERSAMKIGTDGTLLGALGGDKALQIGAGRILDIGTGTGLIALMVAQKVESSEAHITGIEKDAEAAAEATENAAQSSFAPFVEILEGDFLDYSPKVPFDLILSNPPFFTATHSAPDERRTIARHIGSLSPETLFRKAYGMLTDCGQMMIIHPASNASDFDKAAIAEGLFVTERKWIRTVPGKTPKRVVTTLAKDPSPNPSESTLLIHDTSGAYASEYRTLLAPYLTIF